MNDEKYVSNLVGAFATLVAGSIEEQISTLNGRSLSHESALVAIYHHPNETIDTLSKVLGLTHSGTVRLLNALESEGLVVRRKSSHDARAVVLEATEKAKARVLDILSCREHAIAQVMTRFTETQKEEFLALLKVAMGNVADDQVEAMRICRLCDEGVCRKVGCPVEASIECDY